MTTKIIILMVCNVNDSLIIHSNNEIYLLNEYNFLPKTF